MHYLNLHRGFVEHIVNSLLGLLPRELDIFARWSACHVVLLKSSCASYLVGELEAMD